MNVEPLIKSRPTYAPVAVQPRAQRHLFVSTQPGFPVLEPLIAAVPEAKRQVLVLEQDGAQLAQALDAALNDAPLSTAFYVAGSEAFIWDVRNLARSWGFADEQIQLCEPVDNARRLFCTHCYEITEAVTQSPQACAGCGRLLLVRDHYSKLHAAYVGVQINAEDPADIPATEELV